MRRGTGAEVTSVSSWEGPRDKLKCLWGVNGPRKWVYVFVTKAKVNFLLKN